MERFTVRYERSTPTGIKRGKRTVRARNQRDAVLKVSASVQGSFGHWACTDPRPEPEPEPIPLCGWCGGECDMPRPFPNRHDEVFCSPNHRSSSNRAIKRLLATGRRT